jgi:hypothetical protein
MAFKKRGSFCFLPVGFQPRPVFVQVYDDGDDPDDGFTIYPIIGVETELREFDGEDETEVNHAFVYFDNEWGLIPVNSDLIKPFPGEVAFCSWSPLEDKQQLAKVIGRLKDELGVRERKEKAERLKKATA